MIHDHHSVSATSGRQRIIGLDIARAFAIIGMVMVNFKIAMGAEETGPHWLRTFAALFNGRSAATFVILAGVGASLGSRRARESASPTERRRAQGTLAKRALFLFVIGWAFFTIWPADILHYYGVYLAIGSVVLFAPSRRLLTVAAMSVAVSFVFIVAFDPLANWNLDDYSYRGLNTPRVSRATCCSTASTPCSRGSPSTCSACGSAAPISQTRSGAGP